MDTETEIRSEVTKKEFNPQTFNPDSRVDLSEYYVDDAKRLLKYVDENKFPTLILNHGTERSAMVYNQIITSSFHTIRVYESNLKGEESIVNGDLLNTIRVYVHSGYKFQFVVGKDFESRRDYENCSPGLKFLLDNNHKYENLHIKLATDKFREGLDGISKIKNISAILLGDNDKYRIVYNGSENKAFVGLNNRLLTKYYSKYFDDQFKVLSNFNSRYLSITA